jgi:hypothetical protein
MDRRLTIVALACWPTARLFAQDERPRPRYKISAEELHKAMSQRFPVRLGVPGVIELEISAPRLHLLPARNQLGAGLVAQASGSQLRQVPPGEVDIVFTLRYEASDQTVRAHRLQVLDLRWPELPRENLATLKSLLPLMTRDAVGEVVLHRFSQRELALADTMGYEPAKLEVVHDGLVIVFGPKTIR